MRDLISRTTCARPDHLMPCCDTTAVKSKGMEPSPRSPVCYERQVARPSSVEALLQDRQQIEVECNLRRDIWHGNAKVLIINFQVHIPSISHP